MCSQIGISVAGEKYIQAFDSLNLQVGVPFKLSGSDEKKPVTFELQAKWKDFYGNVEPEKKRRDKFSIGVGDTF